LNSGGSVDPATPRFCRGSHSPIVLVLVLVLDF
jgi:hypothetical protein